ncbi:DUF1488 domain-containing protein [Caballeronia sp. LjRoot34]|uniref:DUF1488 family protein n=1 Tax=Caballeronia sp. LjRoot34 TaxID=3342325 RepID=UPI003ECDCF08
MPTEDVALSSDGRLINFVTFAQRHPVRCAITREALEQWFWVPPRASEERLMKCFADGRKRISAVAERKWLALRSDTVILSASDFSL